MKSGAADRRAERQETRQPKPQISNPPEKSSNAAQHLGCSGIQTRFDNRLIQFHVQQNPVCWGKSDAASWEIAWIPDLIRTSIYDKYSGSMKIATPLDHIRHFKTASNTNRSNRWTCRIDRKVGPTEYL